MIRKKKLSLISDRCVLQVGRGFNRDYWARFERFVNLLTRSCNDVFVVTGPLYLPTQTSQGYVLQHPMIGESPPLIMLTRCGAGPHTISCPGVFFCYV